MMEERRKEGRMEEERKGGRETGFFIPNPGQTVPRPQWKCESTCLAPSCDSCDKPSYRARMLREHGFSLPQWWLICLPCLCEHPWSQIGNNRGAVIDTAQGAPSIQMLRS